MIRNDMVSPHDQNSSCVVSRITYLVVRGSHVRSKRRRVLPHVGLCLLEKCVQEAMKLDIVIERRFHSVGVDPDDCFGRTIELPLVALCLNLLNEVNQVLVVADWMNGKVRLHELVHLTLQLLSQGPQRRLYHARQQALCGVGVAYGGH